VQSFSRALVELKVLKFVTWILPYRVLTLARDDRPRVTIAHTENHQNFNNFISTNMTPIEAVLDSLKSLKPVETPNYAKISKKYGCD
jgi:hypothetical protein